MAFALSVITAGYLLPGKMLIPVLGATQSDWNHKTFWHEPWGLSGVHKGIDIFAKNGQPVLSSTAGIRLFSGELGVGGHVALLLGPQWRLHYYAHLNQPSDAPLFVGAGQKIGEVGTSGNATGKQPHLHYSVVSVMPIPWRWSGATQGWKQMFFLNPHELLQGAESSASIGVRS